jgi:hypothetical protein
MGVVGLGRISYWLVCLGAVAAHGENRRAVRDDFVESGFSSIHGDASLESNLSAFGGDAAFNPSAFIPHAPQGFESIGRSAASAVTSRDWGVVVRVHSRYGVGDDVAPPLIVSTSAQAPHGFSGGATLMTTRRLIAPPTYDADVDGLVTSGMPYQAHLSRFHVRWQAARWEVLVGTFAIGFGQRVTLGTTPSGQSDGIKLADDFARPRGFVRACQWAGLRAAAAPGCADDSASKDVSADFRLRNVFRGIAASAQRLELSASWSISAYGFASHQPRTVSQYALIDGRTCLEDSDNCEAPVVLRRGSPEPLTSSLLPSVYDELSAGGHLELSATSSFSVGLTGYAAAHRFHGAPMQLRLRDWTGLRAKGPFGAVGMNGRWSPGFLYLTAEATHAFEIGKSDAARSASASDSLGALVRISAEWVRGEAALLARYYGRQFNNPLARPVSSSDEFEGSRARNEFGVRAAAKGSAGEGWAWRGWVDVSSAVPGSPEAHQTKSVDARGLVGVTNRRWAQLNLGAWGDVSIRPRSRTSFVDCADDAIWAVEAPSECSAKAYRVSLRAEAFPRSLLIGPAIQGSVRWRDATIRGEQMGVEVVGSFDLRSRPHPAIALSARGSYRASRDGSAVRHEELILAAVDAQWLASSRTRVSARYELAFLRGSKEPAPPRGGRPNHLISLDFEATF